MAKPIHWTENSTDEFANRLSFDFITQLAKQMETLPLKQGEFARKLGLSKGRISQILNNPGNLTLNKAIQYARALGMKVTVVAYDDNDPKNERGPINADIFRLCWERAQKPVDFSMLRDIRQTVATNDNEKIFDGNPINENLQNAVNETHMRMSDLLRENQ